LWHKKSNALVLLLTYFFYIAAVVVNVIMPNVGMKNENLLVYNTLMYGSIFEIFIFMILMGKETLGIYRERANLLEKQQAHQAEIIEAIVQSQEIERNKVGRELHDMIGANLSVIRQNIDKSNKQLMSVMESTVKTVRSLSHGLVTPMIRDGALKDEIIELCILFSNENIRILPYFHNWKNIENPELATHIYRIVQELLQNAVKHSGASEVSIQFIVDDEGKKTIMYEDNGSGFDYTQRRKSGRGLINIENRVKLINGTLRTDTRANGKGTTILIEA
jgi:signal transduction histidine kinase